MDILIYPFEGEEPLFEIEKLTYKSPLIRISRLIYRVLRHSAKQN
jgi:hypothetical protein